MKNNNNPRLADKKTKFNNKTILIRLQNLDNVNFLIMYYLTKEYIT